MENGDTPLNSTGIEDTGHPADRMWGTCDPSRQGDFVCRSICFGRSRPYSRRVIGFAVGVIVVSLVGCGTDPSAGSLGPPRVTATFSVGAGPLSDVASDTSTHKGYVTSRDDDALYVVDAESRTATIKVGKAPAGVAVDPTTQTAYVTGEN
jgi:YVTN family beta-propeller protein